jgi:peptide/nickel transport system substrate-binding protein
VRSLFGTLNPRLVPLNNFMYGSNQSTYQQHWNRWKYNPAKAAKILRSHGCAKGGDGLFRCNGVKLSFSFESTSDNNLRELAFEFMQKQAQAAGIDLVPDFKPAATFLGADLPAHDFEMAMFAFVFSADPQFRVRILKCNGASNWTEYCNGTVSRELLQTKSILNPRKRAALFNKIDAQVANDVPVLPLYQEPTYLVYKSSIHGMIDDPNDQGPTWNVENWSRS